MTKATDNFAKSVLSGVISTVGIIPNAIANSRVGRAFFRTGPGEVALASMVSFCECIQYTFPETAKSFLLACFGVVFTAYVLV